MGVAAEVVRRAPSHNSHQMAIEIADIRQERPGSPKSVSLLGLRRRVDRVEFVADDPLSRSLVFTFSTGGRSDYLLPEDEEGSCRVPFAENAADPPDLKTAKDKGDQTQLEVFPVQGSRKWDVHHRHFSHRH